MKTLNPNIKMFKTEEQARREFSKADYSVQLLKATNGFFYVDKSKKALDNYPNLYTLISEK